MSKNAIKLLILIAFMASGCSLDLKTKELVKENLQEQSITLIDNFFDLSYVENHAIAFGFLGNMAKNIRIPLIFILTISATLCMFYFISKIRHEKLSVQLPFFIILGGAYGNIIDRMINGFVTDFFHVHYFCSYNFPVFNVADVLINIGIILMLIQWKKFTPVFERFFKTDVETISKAPFSEEK